MSKPKNDKQLQQNNKFYFSFTSRLIFNIIVFILLLVIGLFLLNNSLMFENEKVIGYNETSNLDYRVYLHKNEFYEQPYLGKDMLYVASLIDKIQIDFDYTFEIDDNENLDFTYGVLGKLSISNASGTRLYYDKTYTLMSDKKISMENSNITKIKEQIDIDYAYYNSLANRFRTLYGVETDSKLTVYMVINKKSNENSKLTLDNSSEMNITIPLSEKAIDIKMDYQNINSSSSLIKKQDYSIGNIILLVLSIILIVTSLVAWILVVKKLSLLSNKKSNYDKYIKKLLKEYDRLIAESTTLISFDDKEIVKINKFTELLDIHDNLQLPIMYYSIVNHQKCYFYINHGKTIYLLAIKAIDLEVSSNAKNQK